MDNFNSEIEKADELRQAAYENNSLESFLKTNSIGPKTIVVGLWFDDIIKNLDLITKYVCSIDELIAEMPYDFVALNYQEFMEHGASIDFHYLADHMTDLEIAICLECFIENGLDGQDLVMKLEPISASVCIPVLQKYGIDISFLKNRPDWPTIKAAYESNWPGESI